MKPYLLFVLGVVMALGALWGGSYAMHVLTLTHWASFPALMTGLACFFAGLYLAVNAAIEISDQHS